MNHDSGERVPSTWEIPGGGDASPARARKDFLIVQCPFMSINIPPLGVAYLMSSAKARGFSGAFYDFSISIGEKVQGHKRKARLWSPRGFPYWREDSYTSRLFRILDKEIEYCVSTILKAKTPVVGFSTYVTNLRFSMEVARRLKTTDGSLVIVFGGPSSRDLLKRDDLGSIIDSVVVGEAEETFVELLERIHNGRPLTGLTGAKSCSTGSSSPYEPRGVPRDLDRLPFPDYDEINPWMYPGWGENLLPLLLSRGCIAKCAYCDIPYLIGSCRTRSPGNVVAEIEQVISRYGIRLFHFNDSLVNANIQQLSRFCDLIIERGIDARFIGLVRVRPMIGDELLRKMKRAGFTYLQYGLESASNKVLRLMRKGNTAEDAARAIRASHEAGITTTANFIVGFPGEEEEDFRQTLNFIEQNIDYIFKVDTLQTCYIPEGSELARNPGKFGVTIPAGGSSNNWYTRDGNTLAVREKRLHRAKLLLARLGKPYKPLPGPENPLAPLRTRLVIRLIQIWNSLKKQLRRFRSKE